MPISRKNEVLVNIQDYLQLLPVIVFAYIVFRALINTYAHIRKRTRKAHARGYYAYIGAHARGAQRIFAHPCVYVSKRVEMCVNFQACFLHALLAICPTGFAGNLSFEISC